MNNTDTKSNAFYTRQSREMDRLLRLDRALCDLIGKLPKGSLVKKDIRGHQIFALQFMEAGKKRFHYMDAAEGELCAKRLEERRNRISALKELSPYARSLIKLFRDMNWPIPPEVLAIAQRSGDFYRLLPYNQDFSHMINHDDWLKALPLVHGLPQPYPEGLRHRTRGGDLVRSKIEITVADILFCCGLPYRYEPLLQLNGRLARPDFASCLPEEATLTTAAPTIIECLGKLHEPKYRQEWREKEELYAKNGFLEGKNLVLIYHHEDRGFDSERVHQQLQNYFGF